MPSPIIIGCSKILKELGLTIAFAESVSAGRLAYEFSMTEDSGSILKGGIVCYDAELKENILGINPAFIEEFTPESEQVTREMAIRLKNLIKSDIQVAITGLTKPGGSETSQKPVGTVFIHICVDNKSIAARKVFEGTPEEIVLSAADMVAQAILKELEESV